MSIRTLNEVPEKAISSMQVLRPDGKPAYYEEYSDGCYYLENTDGWYQWVSGNAKHSPHDKFVNDNPIAYWELLND